MENMHHVAETTIKEELKKTDPEKAESFALV